MREHLVVVHRPGPAWNYALGFRAQAGAAEHAAHYRQEVEAGRLLAGGPFADEPGGGMMVYRAGIERSQVEAHAAADPAVASGLLRYEVRPWLRVFGD